MAPILFLRVAQASCVSTRVPFATFLSSGVAMRLPVYVLALVCGTVVSCSSEHRSPTEAPPVKSVGVKTIDLAFSSSTPLFTSRANAINDSGVVVGWAAINAADSTRAVVWRPPSYRVEFLPDQNAENGSSANGVGRDGVIGGQIGCARTGAVSCTPVYWRADVLHVLDGVGQVNAVCPCDSHTLVGQVVVNGALHGALWIDDVLIDVGTPPGTANAQLVAVAHGFIVGNAFDDTLLSPGVGTGFRWSPSSGWTRLNGPPPFGVGFVSDVNSSGTALGVATVGTLWLNGSNTGTAIPEQQGLDLGGFETAINDSSVVAGLFIGGGHPFPVAAIWTQADGWTPIGGEINPRVTDINNSNEVVGYWATDGAGFDALLWQP